jgi:hypothetical protein
MTRRRLKRALIALLIGLPIALVLIVVLAVLLAPLIFTSDDVKREAVSALTQTLGTPASIERVSYGPLTGIELFGVVIGPPEGFTEDVARIERVAILYDLSGIVARKVRVTELAVEHTRVTMETKLGPDGLPFTNIDAINQKLAENAASEPDAPEEKKSAIKGPLSPLDITVEKLVLTDLSIRAVGEGPKLSLSGIDFLSDASIGRERLGARAKLTISAKEPNLILDHPGLPLLAKLSFNLTASSSVAAASSSGLSLEDVGFELEAHLSGDVRFQGNDLPKLDVQLGGLLAVKPKEDRAQLSPLKLTFDQQVLVDLGVNIDGLVGLLGDLMGPPAAEALADSIGLEKKRPDGIIKIALRSMMLPLGTLAPYASIFVPGLEASGGIRLSPLEVEGTMLEIMRGVPRRFALRLDFEETAVKYPAAQVDVRSVDGSFTLDRASDGASYALNGGLTVDRLKQQANLVERSGLEIRALVERLTYPLPGHTEIEAKMFAAGVTAPPATVGRADLTFALTGEEILAKDRQSLPLLEVKLGLVVDRARATTGTVTHEVGGLDVAVTAALERLLQPNEKPIEATVEVRVARVQNNNGLSVERTKLGVAAQLSDPRTGKPIDVRAKTTLSAGLAKVPAATVKDLNLTLDTQADAVAERVVPGLPRGMLPASVVWQLQAQLPDIVVHDRANGDIPTTLAIKTNGSVDLVRSTANLSALSLDVWDTIHLKANGRFAKIMAKDLYSDAKVEIAPLELTKLLERVPQELLEKYAPDLSASGKIGMSARIKGDLPENFAKIDLGAPPLEAGLRMSFDSLSAKLPKSNVDFENMNGTVTAEIGRGKSELLTDLSISRVILASGTQARPIEGLTFQSRAGLRGELWELQTNLDASGKEPASFDIDLAYEKRSDLTLRRFDVRLPAAGIEFDMSGRLARRAFGVLRPELAMKTRINLDRFASVFPEANAAHGIFAANLEVLSPLDTRVDIYGLLEVDNFSYAKGTLAVDGATGRIPIDQRLVLAQPIMRELIASAEGVLGDDLERRLEELGNDFRAAKMVLDRQDILLEAPRAADYQPLRPYYAEKGARLSIASVKSGGETIKNIVLDGLWHSGVLRADRFAAQLWDGDILGDLAVQVTSDLNGRLRMRGTFTNLNLDLPYAQAKDIPPVTDPDEKEEYEIAGTIDLRVELRERSITLKLDLTKLKKPTLDRLFGYLDPKNEKPSMDSAKFALKLSEVFGLQPTAGQFTIARNIVSMNVDFRRVWIPEHWALKVFAPARFVAIPLFGSMIVGNVNGALPKSSIGAFIEPEFDKLGLDAMLSQYLGGRVIAEDLTERPEIRTASP